MSYYGRKSYNDYSSSSTKLVTKLVIFVICIIVYLLFALGSCSIKNGNEREEICIITDKGIKRINETDKYLIYGKDENGESVVYEITDSFVYGRYDSANTYGAIVIGEKYKFTVVGSRIPVVSYYPNILDYEEIKE